jgi:hypothetical protein
VKKFELVVEKHCGHEDSIRYGWCKRKRETRRRPANGCTHPGVSWVCATFVYPFVSLHIAIHAIAKKTPQQKLEVNMTMSAVPS